MDASEPKRMMTLGEKWLATCEHCPFTCETSSQDDLSEKVGKHLFQNEHSVRFWKVHVAQIVKGE